MYWEQEYRPIKEFVQRNFQYAFLPQNMSTVVVLPGYHCSGLRLGLSTGNLTRTTRVIAFEKEKAVCEEIRRRLPGLFDKSIVLNGKIEDSLVLIRNCLGPAETKLPSWMHATATQAADFIECDFCGELSETILSFLSNARHIARNISVTLSINYRKNNLWKQKDALKGEHDNATPRIKFHNINCRLIDDVFLEKVIWTSHRVFDSFMLSARQRKTTVVHVYNELSLNANENLKSIMLFILIQGECLNEEYSFHPQSSDGQCGTQVMGDPSHQQASG